MIIRKLSFIVFGAASFLAACNVETSSNVPLESTAKPIETAEKSKTIIASKPDYDFERQLKNCVLAVCKLDITEKMKVSDYSPELISDMDLSQADTLATARQKINSYYSGMVSSGLGGTTDPSLKVLKAQLSPATNKSLPEYDIFIRTKGMDNGAQVHDWGARIRCGPVMANSQWQTKLCD